MATEALRIEPTRSLALPVAQGIAGALVTTRLVSVSYAVHATVELRVAHPGIRAWPQPQVAGRNEWDAASGERAPTVSVASARRPAPLGETSLHPPPARVNPAPLVGADAAATQQLAAATLPVAEELPAAQPASPSASAAPAMIAPHQAQIETPKPAPMPPPSVGQPSPTRAEVVRQTESAVAASGGGDFRANVAESQLDSSETGQPLPSGHGHPQPSQLTQPSELAAGADVAPNALVTERSLAAQRTESDSVTQVLAPARSAPPAPPLQPPIQVSRRTALIRAARGWEPIRTPMLELQAGVPAAPSPLRGDWHPGRDAQPRGNPLAPARGLAPPVPPPPAIHEEAPGGSPESRYTEPGSNPGAQVASGRGDGASSGSPHSTALSSTETVPAPQAVGIQPAAAPGPGPGQPSTYAGDLHGQAAALEAPTPTPRTPHAARETPRPSPPADRGALAAELFELLHDQLRRELLVERERAGTLGAGERW